MSSEAAEPPSSTPPPKSSTPPADLSTGAAAVPDLSASAPAPESAVKFTRAAALWSAMLVGFLILTLLLVFILQNTGSTTIHFFGLKWNLPVGVAILLSAVCGGLVTVAAGTARIFQLHRAAKKNLKAR